MSSAGLFHGPPPAGRRPAVTATRERILEVTLELFSEQGYDGTTLQRIADRLGFTKAALYYHFRSKEDLLTALVTPATVGLDRLLDAHEGVPDTASHRRRFIADYLDYLLDHRRLMAYMASDLAIVAHPVLAEGSGRRRARVQAKLAGQDLDFNEQVRFEIALRGIPRVIAQYPDADTEQLRNALLDAACVLLRPRVRRGLKGASGS